MLYFFFLRLQSPLTMNITCYYYLKVGLKEAAWSSSILRGRQFCYVGAHSPKNLKIYLSCFSEVIRLCWLVDLPVSKFLQRHYRLSQPRQELNLISIRQLLPVCLITALVINVTWFLCIALYRSDLVYQDLTSSFFSLEKSIWRDAMWHYVLRILLSSYIFHFLPRVHHETFSTPCGGLCQAACCTVYKVVKTWIVNAAQCECKLR